MEFYQVVEKRRTVREFSPRAIPKEKVIRIIKAGIKSPTYNHLREWDFILIHDTKTRLDIIKTEKIAEKYNVEELQELFKNYDNTAKNMYIDALPKQKRMVLTAPELLVVVYKPKTQVAKSKCAYDLNCLASVWCCIENILLAMAEEDLFGVTFVPQYTGNLKKVLNIPAHLEVASIIPFGYREENAKYLKQKDVNINQKIHYNGW